MQGSPQPLGTLKVALGHAAQLLETDPAAAAEQAREILKVVPGEPAATLVLGTAHRACGDLAEALTVLEDLVAAHPKWAGAHFELGVTCSRAERSEQAVASLRKAVELKPDHA